MTRLIGLFVVAGALLCLPGQAVITSGQESTVSGVVLVRYASGAEPGVVASARGAEYNGSLDLWRLEVGDGRVEQMLEELSGDPAVEFAQPMYRYTNASEPDDPVYRSTQHVHFRAINLQAAWEAVNPLQPVTVAVIDGGVDVNHPDLDTRIWQNPGEEPNALDDDGNGCVDDLFGCSFQSAAPDGDIADRDGHGTFAAGLIAAERGNGEYVAGIAENASIMAVRALDPLGKGDTEQLAESILYAARNGADVLNLSLAIPPEAGICPTDAVVESAIDEAVNLHGAVVLAAVGNDEFGCVSYPASSPLAIAAAGSGPPEATDSHAFFSQWGPEVDVAAPAMGLSSLCPIPTAVPNPLGYCRGAPTGIGDGTSFSTPIVTGVAALLLGANPDWTPDQVMQRLKDTARDLPDEGELNWDGAGIIDAGAALGTGSAWSSLDARGDDLSSVSLTVAVGEVSSPLCEANAWERPEFHVKETSSSLGVGDCSAFWPPSPDQPWNLVATTVEGKANGINSWMLATDGLSCRADGLPAYVTATSEVIASIACAGSGPVYNDQPESALTVGPELPRQYQQDVRYATVVDEPPSTCGPYTRSVWYRVPAAIAAEGVVVDTLEAKFNSLVTVYRDDSGALTQVACNDNVNPPVIQQSRLAFKGDGVSDYVVKVAAFSITRAAVIRVNFSALDSPGNDDTSGAVPLAIDGPKHLQPAHNSVASATDPDLSCAGNYGFTTWYSVTPDVSGPLTVRTSGSTFDTVMGAFDGAVQVGCNDQEAVNLDTSKVTWNAEAGTTYTVVVGSFLGRAAGVLHIAAESGP